MANYSFVINSQFKPFSYAELLAPVHASTEAHQKVEEEYNALSSQAETLRARAEQEAIANPNSRWVKRYNDYANKLEQSASDLAQHGLQPGVRQQIREAKKDYFNSVDPAVKAIAQQQKLSDMQYAQNPALRMVYGDMPTVDQLIGDMTLKPVSYSGQDIYTQAMTSSKTASARNVVSEFMRDPKFAGYIRQVKAAGYNAKTIDDMLKIPELQGVVNMVKTQFGGFDGVSEKNQKKLEGEVLKGLFDGVGYNKEEQLIYNQTEAQQRQFAHDVAMEAMRERAQASQASDSTLGGGGVPGETIPVHFTDKGQSGQALKEKASGQTLAYIKYRIGKGDKDAANIKKYWETHGDKKKSWESKAVEHWTRFGFNGAYLQNDKGQWTALGIGLRGYLRKNLTGNENIINIWASPFAKESSVVSYSPSINGGYSTVTKVPGGKKWGNWDSQSVGAYTVNGIGLNDKPEQLKTYLDRVISRDVQGGRVKLYDLQGIDKNGNYTYGNSGMKYDDLPKNSSGDIDYSRIHRAMLSNGDFMLYWNDGKNTVRKILKRSDISREAVQEWNNYNNAYGASFRKYVNGQMSKDEQGAFLQSLGYQHLYNTYSLGQNVNVKDYEVK